MHLYEITNGWVGEGLVCSYAWAESDEAALALAHKAFEQAQKEHKYPPYFSENLKIRRLFSATDASFCTVPSSDGWPEEEV